jgi:hypothetical protein
MMFNGHLKSDTFLHFSQRFPTALLTPHVHACSQSVMLWSCIALLFGSMFLADLFQSSVRILSPRYLPRVIPVCTYMLRFLE